MVRRLQHLWHEMDTELQTGNHTLDAGFDLGLAGQFLVMYKRGGQRVIINALGDMLVRPSFIEVSVRSGGVPLRLSFHVCVCVCLCTDGFVVPAANTVGKAPKGEFGGLLVSTGTTVIDHSIARHAPQGLHIGKDCILLHATPVHGPPGCDLRHCTGL